MNSLDPWRLIATDVFGDVVWPRPYYGHPFYREIPSWIHYGAPDGATRQLFDGAFVGADHAGASMSNGITFKKELDANQILRVEICVDGKCHRTAMDLGPAIAMILAKLARAHTDLHRAMLPALSGDAVAAAVDRAVHVAGDALIGKLAQQHAQQQHAHPHQHHAHGSTVAVEGFFDSIEHALSGAANAVGGVLKSLKGPASLAAGAAATAFGGPAAGAAAAKLTGTLIDAAPGGGHPATQAAAKQTVAAAKQVARTNPTVQAALDAAHHAVSQTTMAALGHVPAVPATPNTMAAAVQKFLPLATQAVTGSGGGGGGSPLPVNLQSALSTFGGLLGGGGGGSDGGGDDGDDGTSVSGCTACEARRGRHDVVGAALDAVRSHAQSIASANNASVVGVIRTARGNWQARGFRDADVADDWLGAATAEPSSFTYAAVYDKSDVMWPHPLNEKVGTARGRAVPEPSIPREVATTSGARW